MPEYVANIEGVVRNGAGSGAFAGRYRAQALAVHLADDAHIGIVVYDAGGTPLDLTGCALSLAVKPPRGGDPLGPVIFARQAVLDDAPNGVAHFELGPNDSKLCNVGSYTYDVVLQDATTPTPKRTHVVPLGDFTVLDTANDDGLSPTLTAGSNLQRIVVAFNNAYTATQAYAPFPGAPVLDAQCGIPVVLTGDFPSGIAVTALSNGSITVTANATFTGYVVVEIEVIA